MDSTFPNADGQYTPRAARMLFPRDPAARPPRELAARMLFPFNEPAARSRSPPARDTNPMAQKEQCEDPREDPREDLHMDPHEDDLADSAWLPVSPGTRRDLITSAGIPDTCESSEVFRIAFCAMQNVFAVKIDGGVYVVKAEVSKMSISRAQVSKWQGTHACPSVVKWEFNNVLDTPVMHAVNGVHMLRLMQVHADNNSCVDADRLCMNMQQLMLGIDYLHTKQCAHGDLAPQNVMCQPDGHVVIVDTDGAMLRFIEDTQFASGQRTSASIMSPEVARIYNPKTSSEIEKTADVWALGMLLMLLVEGIDVELQHNASDEGTAMVPTHTPFKGEALRHIWFLSDFTKLHAPPQVCVLLLSRQHRLVPTPLWVAPLLWECLQPDPHQRGGPAARLALLPPDGGGPLRPNLQM